MVDLMWDAASSSKKRERAKCRVRRRRWTVQERRSCGARALDCRYECGQYAGQGTRGAKSMRLGERIKGKGGNGGGEVWQRVLECECARPGMWCGMRAPGWWV